MTFGLEVTNSSNQLVIDSTFLNYGMIAQGSVAVTVKTTVEYHSGIFFPVPSSADAPPLIAVKWAPDSDILCGGVRMVGAPGAWSGFELAMLSMGSQKTVTLEYKVFDANISYPFGFAMQIFSPAGQVAFDSSFAPMQIAGYVYPNTWVGVGNSSPAIGVRRLTYNAPSPVANGFMVLSTHRFGDLAYYQGIEGQTPVALASYFYGYVSPTVLRLMVILQTYTNANPGALSTPNAYVSAMIT